MMYILIHTCIHQYRVCIIVKCISIDGVIAYRETAMLRISKRFELKNLNGNTEIRVHMELSI